MAVDSGCDDMASFELDVHSHPSDSFASLSHDVRGGLGSRPKELAPKWFYDELGSVLFDAITRLDEYYLTRAERSILEASAAEIVNASGADTLVELGSGTSDKTRLLLDALQRRPGPNGYVPFDVSEEMLRKSAGAIASGYPGLNVHGVVGDFERHLGLIPRTGRRLMTFLGSTIGNFDPKGRYHFLADLAAGMDDHDALLIGYDLIKDVTRLEAAYDDAVGVTAAFNKNILRVLNRRLGANFDVARFSHVARYDGENQWIEMSLRADAEMTVFVASLDMMLSFDEGESIRTEISTKFALPSIADELETAGLQIIGSWTDADEDFALVLAGPAPDRL